MNDRLWKTRLGRNLVARKGGRLGDTKRIVAQDKKEEGWRGREDTN